MLLKMGSTRKPVQVPRVMVWWLVLVGWTGLGWTGFGWIGLVGWLWVGWF